MHLRSYVRRFEIHLLRHSLALPALILCVLRSMFNATEVLISGASAGGIGAFVNADFIADLLPGATVRSCVHVHYQLH